MVKHLVLTMFVATAACDDGGTPATDAPPTAADAPPTTADAPPTTADAPPTADATPATVVEVACAGATIASEVSAPGFSFVITQGTIAAGSVVRFTMPGSHSVVSGATPGVDDGVFSVSFNTTRCLRFTAAGAFPFWCNPHRFTGTLTVTP